eukprot:1991463-Pyramimonas_sp.AAC.1
MVGRVGTVRHWWRHWLGQRGQWWEQLGQWNSDGDGGGGDSRVGTGNVVETVGQWRVQWWWGQW